MSNMTNTEAFDGMREAEQISRPIVELLKSLQRQMEEQNQKLENYLSQLKEEKRPRQLEAQLREAERECAKALDSLSPDWRMCPTIFCFCPEPTAAL